MEGSAEVLGELVADAGDVGGSQAFGGGQGGAVAAGVGLVVDRGEATSAQFQAFDFVADQVGTGGNFRQ
ncbi:hypothetical protein D3C78_1620870 [compost metagenome]